jgi:hypothetical protein
LSVLSKGNYFVIFVVLVLGCNKYQSNNLDKLPNDSEANLSCKSWDKLLSFIEKPLYKLNKDSKDEVESLVLDIFPNRKKDSSHFEFEPWYFWKVDGKQIHFILLETASVWTVPGTTPVSLHIFDSKGILLKSLQFHTGHRIYLRKAVLIQSFSLEKIKIPVIEFSVEFSGMIRVDENQQQIFAKQYYAFMGDNIVLIRLEDHDGFIIRKRYDYGQFAPLDLPKRSEKEWEIALLSNNEVEILQTLVWMGGIHYYENIEDIQLLENLRKRNKVQQCLNKLKKSGNKWIREAASLATNPKYYINPE